MVENALGVLLCFLELGHDLPKLLKNIKSFQSLEKVMETKTITTKDERHVTIIDDSHNAAIPSMINAINTFNEKAQFYTGKKILVLGQVADLGEQSEILHDQLWSHIINSEAELVFGHGTYMRKIIQKLPPEKTGGWFVNARTLSTHIPLYCTDDSLIVLKGSVSGSDFRQTSNLLPLMLRASSTALQSYTPDEIANLIQPAAGLSIYHQDSERFMKGIGYTATKAIEGLAPILLYYLIVSKGMDLNKASPLNKWPTNKGKSFNGKPFRQNELFSNAELLEELKITQHPSAVYELAYRRFRSRINALEEIQKLGSQLGIPIEATLNLTGRYRLKEQQRYGLKELEKIAKILAVYKKELHVLDIIGGEKVYGFIFGELRKSAIIYVKDDMVIACGYKNEYALKSAIQSIFLKK